MRCIDRTSFGIRQQSFAEVQVCGRPGSKRFMTCGFATRRDTRADIAEAKFLLLDAIVPTNRGGTASSSQRAAVLDAQVGLEALSGGAVDYSLLPGSWRLLYTTAPDVRPLLIANRAAPFQVGNIYQQFSAVEQGDVQNIIEFSIPLVLQKGTVEVRAKYDVRSPQRIRLVFQEAGVRNFSITDELELLLAPAILPRSWLNHQILLALREAEVFVPLRARLPALAQASKSLERNFGSDYLLSYLDEEILIGSQTGSGGTFIFVRD